ncbi:hypothetical protein [Subtercola boreus]|nr:hypothetical protein [Subtercola boreus]
MSDRRSSTDSCLLTRMEFSVLDVFFVAGIIVLFAIVALVAKGVEKL